MEWVKSKIGYYRHIAIATGSDALEVMFKRADALAGEIGEDGFIPDAMLLHLARRPTQAKRLASELVKSGLWERVKGGYLIVDWADINAEAVRLTARKKRDRERKRADRAASRDVSTDESTDAGADCPGESLLDHESESQSKKAAAAGVVTVGPDRAALPPAVSILRGSLEAHKLIVRWDTLTAADAAEIERLAVLHGDTALVKSALASYQPNKPPATAKAWLRQWCDLRAPGDLTAVPDPCPGHGHTGTTKHCTQCASEQKAANR